MRCRFFNPNFPSALPSRARNRRLAALGLLLVGLWGLPGLGAAQSVARAVGFDDVLAAFAEGDATVPVLVSLRADEGAGPAAIREAREAILADFAPGALSVRVQYHNFPGFSADVTLDAYQALLEHAAVEAVSPVRLLRTHLAQGIPLIRGMTYRASYPGDGVAVAIVDTGVDSDHPRLGDGGFPNVKVIGGYDFGNGDTDPRPDGNAHGTACAGIVAGGLGTTGDYIGGVAYNAKVYALKVTPGDNDSTTEDKMLAAWDWCITHKEDDPDNPIVVINTSLGWGRYYDTTTCDTVSPLARVAAQSVTAAGIALVASTGNDGYSDSITFPACLSEVISVSGVYDANIGAMEYSMCEDDSTRSDVVPCEANNAAFVDLMAPSYYTSTVDIAGPGGFVDDDLDDDYATTFGGTSAASAYAAGAAAVLQSVAKAQSGRFMTVSHLKRLLTGTGDNVEDDRDGVVNPRIDLAEAIENTNVLPPLPDPLPPPRVQYDTYDEKLYAYPNFTDGYGASVGWAMGYYLRSMLEARKRGWTSDDLTDPARQMSSEFLFGNGGDNFPFLAAAQLVGYGCATVETCGYYTEIDKSQLPEAAQYKLLSAEPIFINRPLDDDGLYLGGHWRNPTKKIEDALDAGEGVCLGLTVYPSLEFYHPSADVVDVRDVVYDVDPTTDTLEEPAGFQAVACVDYLESIRAFKIVNSWGDQWGVHPYYGVAEVTGAQYIPRGYAWLSYDYVKKYAVEAWRVRAPMPISVTTSPTLKGRAWKTETTDYKIVYRGAGRLEWDAPTENLPALDYTPADGLMLRVVGGGPDDQLKIKRKRGVKVGDAIPLLWTDGGFKNLFTQATINELRADGPLSKIVTKDCHVADILTSGGLGKIRMSARPDSSWPEVAAHHYLDDKYRQAAYPLPAQGIIMKLPNRLYANIVSVAPGVGDLPAVNARFKGVTVKQLVAPGQDIRGLKTATKIGRGQHRRLPRVVSYSGVGGEYVPEVHQVTLEARPDGEAADGPRGRENRSGVNALGLASEVRTIGFQEILAQYADAGVAGGSADVLVELKTPKRLTEATNWRDPVSVAQRQAAVRALRAPVLADLGADFVPRHRYDNFAAFSGAATVDGLARLLQDPRVESVAPVRPMFAHLRQGIPLMQATEFRANPETNGVGLSIAIVDTGVDTTHRDLGDAPFPNDKVIGGYDFGDDDTTPTADGHPHGTCCAGIAAGDVDSVGDYIGGVAPGAKLYALKITQGSGGVSDDATIAAAWDWCVTHQYDDPDNPIMIISTSFGGGRYTGPCDNDSPVLAQAAQSAVAAGITLFVSSGNDGYTNSISSPGCVSSVISVGAVYDSAIAPTGGCPGDTPGADVVTCYSNTADFLKLVAPSDWAYSPDIVGSEGYSPGDFYPYFNGTSAACPYAAGGAAIVQSVAKKLRGEFLTPATLEDLLSRTGDDSFDPRVDIVKPRVNAGRAGALAVPPDVTELGFNWEDTWLSAALGAQPVLTDSDWYKIEITPFHQALSLDCLFANATGDIDVEVYDSDLIGVIVGAHSATDNEHIETWLPRAGVYYIRVYRAEGAAAIPYDLKWDDSLAPTAAGLERTIVGGQIRNLASRGGSIEIDGVFADDLRKASGRGDQFSTVFDGKTIYLNEPGDLSLGLVRSAGAKMKLSATGGDVKAEALVTGGAIPNIRSRYRKWKINQFDPFVAGDEAWTVEDYVRGGVVGFAPAPTSLQVPKWMSIASGAPELGGLFNNRDVRTVFGDLAVFAVMAAGPVEALEPASSLTAQDRIRLVRTRKYIRGIPTDAVDVWWYRVEGEGYSSREIKVRTSEDLFQQNLP